MVIVGIGLVRLKMRRILSLDGNLEKNIGKWTICTRRIRTAFRAQFTSVDTRYELQTCHIERESDLQGNSTKHRSEHLYILLCLW